MSPNEACPDLGLARRVRWARLVLPALVACASPEPRPIPIADARVRAFEACPRPESRRDGAFRALLDARLSTHAGDILALANELRERACLAEVFVSPPVQSVRELHLTYREGATAAWVITVEYDLEGRARIGDVMPKANDPR